MNITLMAHDKKKELMVQFCTAYKSVLSKHNLSATATTGRLVAEATGLEKKNAEKAEHVNTNMNSIGKEANLSNQRMNNMLEAMQDINESSERQ